MAYQPRVVDEELRRKLRAVGAVVVEGPKAVGKTATARQHAASEVLLDVDRQARTAAELDPALILDGPAPRLIDEWQVVPEVWNHVRRAVDDRRAAGQFLLTGSAVPKDDVTRHSGAGRMTRVRLRPMSLFESGHSTGQISLRDLFAGEAPRSPDPGLTIPDVVDLTCVGGWPGDLDLSTTQRLEAVRDYLGEIRRADIPRLEGSARDPEKVARLLRSFARNVATYAATTTLASDTAAGEGTLARDTVSAYLTALDRLMIIEDLPAWAPHLRSKSVLRSAPKRLFVDPSLAVAALRATPQRLLADLEFFGFLFESLAIRDLRIYAQASDAGVLQYRDSTGLEVDAIVEGADGRWAAFEIKLGGKLVEEGAASLLRFKERVDVARCGEPATLAVITASGYGYRREDGISVIPIGALGP